MRPPSRGQPIKDGVLSSSGLIRFVLHTWAGLVPWIWGSDGVQTLLLQRVFVLMACVSKGFCKPPCEESHILLHGNLGTIPRDAIPVPNDLGSKPQFLPSDAVFGGLTSGSYGGREIPPVLGRRVHLHPIVRLPRGVPWSPMGLTSGAADGSPNLQPSPNGRLNWEGEGRWRRRVRESYGVSQTSQWKQGWGSQGKWARLGDAEGHLQGTE